MKIIKENAKLEQFREAFPVQIKREIEKTDQSLEKHTKPHWQNLNYFYKVIDMLEPTQRQSIVMHRELIREQIRIASNIDDDQKENLSYKATLLVLQDAFKHELPALHGDYVGCDKQCDYAKYADNKYVDDMLQALLADNTLVRQHADTLER